LFEAFHMRSAASLEPDVDDIVIDLRDTGAMGDRARVYWISDMTARMKNAPFDQVEVDQMYRSQEVEVYARDELGQPGRPPRPNAMGPDDVLVRVPIATPRLGADPLFGEEIRLLLRRVDTGYKIHGYFEIPPR
jgi:hypothetical protein